MARAVTATDVAREAGVSQATVSYVINNHPNQKISSETRGRVLAAVARLGYTPSAAARALRKGSSDLVLLALPDVPMGPAVADFIERLTDEFELSGLVAITRRVRDKSPVAALWREVRPVAVVSIAALSFEDQAEMRAAGIHVVGTLLSPVSGMAATVTSVLQTVVGRLQVEHLAATGHRRLGYAAPDDERVGTFYHLRLDGVRTACLGLGLDQPDVVMVPLDARRAALVVQQWRSRVEPVTGVCAYNDEVAFAVLAGMHQLGLVAPRDLAVIGVDNIPLAPLASPPLTTVDQNLGVVAWHVAQQIISALRGGSAPPPLRPDLVGLVVRESA